MAEFECYNTIQNSTYASWALLSSMYKAHFEDRKGVSWSRRNAAIHQSRAGNSAAHCNNSLRRLDCNIMMVTRCVLTVTEVASGNTYFQSSLPLIRHAAFPGLRERAFKLAVPSTIRSEQPQGHLRIVYSGVSTGVHRTHTV